MHLNMDGPLSSSLSNNYGGGWVRASQESIQAYPFLLLWVSLNCADESPEPGTQSFGMCKDQTLSLCFTIILRCTYFYYLHFTEGEVWSSVSKVIFQISHPIGGSGTWMRAQIFLYWVGVTEWVPIPRAVSRLKHSISGSHSHGPSLTSAEKALRQGRRQP